MPAENHIFLDHVLPAGHAVGNGVLALRTGEFVVADLRAAEGTGTLVLRRLQGDRLARDALNLGLELFLNGVAVLRTHQHARPRVREVLEVGPRGLDHGSGQDVHRVRLELRNVLAHPVEQPGGRLVVAPLHQSF